MCMTCTLCGSSTRNGLKSINRHRNGMFHLVLAPARRKHESKLHGNSRRLERGKAVLKAGRNGRSRYFGTHRKEECHKRAQADGKKMFETDME